MNVVNQQKLRQQLGGKNYDKLFELISVLRRREIVGSYNVARHTAEFFRSLVSTAHWPHTKEAISVIHKIGNILTSAQPIELCLGNITRRVLTFVREAYAQHKGAPNAASTLQDLLTFTEGTCAFDDVEWKHLKQIVLFEINNLIEELNSMYTSIAALSLDHIHTDEIIMTYGRSNTVVSFLIKAGQKRKFHVIVAEAAPSFKGKATAKELSEAGIDTTLIADSAIFSMMARVNKVIVGTNDVLANGGLLSVSGVRLLAEAAKYYAVPFVVCAGMYKLSPVYPTDRDLFNDMSSPSHIIPFEELDTICKDNPHGVDVLNPDLDYIPPELVSLYLTNYGSHSPPYIYRLLAEYYNLEDYTFKEDNVEA